MKEEMSGMKLSKILALGQTELSTQRMAEIFKKGELRFESAHLRKDDSVFPVETHVKLIEIEGNKYCCSVIRDITKRKLAEEALLQSEARYRRIAEGLTDYQYTVRIENGRAVETKHSPACVAVTGYTAEEFAADPYLWIHMVAPEDCELIIKRVEQIMEGNDILPIEHRIIRKDGIQRWVSDNIILYRDLSGILLSYDGVVKDITERKLAEEERDKLIVEIQEALAKVKHLSGLLPICASCKKIRNDKGFWEQVETYISEHSEALFSHAICPECGKKLYPEYYDKIWGEKDE
jgi:PAS domain S-box-containing protein